MATAPPASAAKARQSGCGTDKIESSRSRSEKLPSITEVLWLDRLNPSINGMSETRGANAVRHSVCAPVE